MTTFDADATHLLTAEDVAAILAVGIDWVYAEARADRIPHVRLGRNVRFRLASIEEWTGTLERGSMPAPMRTTTMTTLNRVAAREASR